MTSSDGICCEDGLHKFDLNKDGFDDITFGASGGVYRQPRDINLYYSKSSYVTLSLSTQIQKVEIIKKSFGYEEIIDSTGNWINLNGNYPAGPWIYYTSLAYFSTDPAVNSSNLFEEEGYFGVRILKENKYYYGWILLRIDNYNVINILSSGYKE